MTHVVPVSEAAMPEKLGEKCLRELRILPAAVLQKLKSLFANVRVLDQLLDVAKIRSLKKFCNIRLLKQQTSFDLTASPQPRPTVVAADRAGPSGRRKCSV